MTGAEFIRLVRRLGRRRGIEVRFVAQRGKGSHGTLYYRKKEFGSGLLHDMLGNLGLDLDELRKGD